MINAEVIKGVHELLGNSGLEPKQDERFGDFVARALGISDNQADVLLETLHDGGTVDDAVSAARIDGTTVNHDLLASIARVIGTTLGRISAI